MRDVDRGRRTVAVARSRPSRVVVGTSASPSRPRSRRFPPHRSTGHRSGSTLPSRRRSGEHQGRRSGSVRRFRACREIADHLAEGVTVDTVGLDPLGQSREQRRDVFQGRGHLRGLSRATLLQVSRSGGGRRFRPRRTLDLDVDRRLQPGDGLGQSRSVAALTSRRSFTARSSTSVSWRLRRPNTQATSVSGIAPKGESTEWARCCAQDERLTVV